MGYFWKKNGKILVIFGKIIFFGKGASRRYNGKISRFYLEKGRLQGTSEIFEKNKVQREKWPVPSNGPPCIYLANIGLPDILVHPEQKKSKQLD